MIHKAKDKATNTEMEQWIQDCYKQEVDCVSTLSQVLRQAIENEEKLVNELALPGAKLEIRKVSTCTYRQCYHTMSSVVIKVNRNGTVTPSINVIAYN